MKRDLFLTSMERNAEMEPSLRPDIADTPLKGVRSNSTVSIVPLEQAQPQEQAQAA